MSTDLKQAFNEVCELFNGASYDDLRPLMDIDIILKKVDDPGSVAGIGNVITYLNGQQASRKPQFRDVKIETVHGENGTNGQISGTAHYRDRKDDTAEIAVRFTFTFSRNDRADNWMLVNAFAAPVE
jgi:hypothetical protein